MLVPGRGFTSYLATALAVDLFHVSRPLVRGSVVGRVWITVQTAGINIVDLVASVGPSGSATLAALEGGVQVVGASDIGAPNLGVLRWGANGAAQHRWSLYAGLPVGSGPGYIVVMLRNGSAVATEVTFSFEVLVPVDVPARTEPAAFQG